MNIYEEKKEIVLNELIKFIEKTRSYKVEYNEIKEIKDKINEILESYSQPL